MDYHVLTLFPEMIEQTVNTSITGRAVKSGKISLHTVNIRDYAQNKYGRVDDYPYGGGAGMVMEPEPVYQAYQAAISQSRVGKTGKKPRCIYLTPQGQVLNQVLVEELALEEELFFLCGHYEGIDERVLEEIVTDYVSIGDYVLTGGELAACVVIDAVSRFVPGVLSNEESSQFESMQDNLLEYPHYTRPEVWRERQVPKVLLGGDHKKIQEWRWQQSLLRTEERRPDLLARNRKVTAAYFSPTGGTEKAVKIFTELLTQNPHYLDLTRRKNRRQEYSFSKQELLVAAAPVYGGQLPRMEDTLFTNLKGDNTPCVILAAYGNRHYDNTLAQMKKLLTDRGFVCIGGAALVISHIYSPKLGAGRPHQKDKKVLEAFGVEIKKRLFRGEEKGFEEVRFPGEAEPQPRPMRPVSKGFEREKCNGCQSCVQKCPVNAISPETLEINLQACLSCMRCVKVCPRQARSFDAEGVREYLETNFSKPREIEIF